MDHIHHFSQGAYTPGMAFLVMMLGAAVGLRCTLRALNSDGWDKRLWLIMGSTAIGSGIWTLHFIAMLGFNVDGTDVRYNVPLTLLSLVLAVVVVGFGVFIVGYSQATGLALLVGGLITGSGVAVMHYSGMAAVRISGTINYDLATVALSIAIALGAAVAVLWIVLNIKGVRATLVAAVIMGVGVSTMHYTAMWAVGVEDVGSVARPEGATAFEFLLPLTVGVGAVLFIAGTFVAVSPIEDEYEQEIAERLRSLENRRNEFNAQLDESERTRQNDRVRRSSGLRTGQQSSASELAGRVSGSRSSRRGRPDN